MNQITSKVALALYNSQSKMEKLFKNKKGATAVEYGLMLVAILLLVALAYKNLGSAVSKAATKAKGEL